MFKRKPKPKDTTFEDVKAATKAMLAAKDAATPSKSPEQTEAERIIERGKKLEKYGSEAAMWRKFAASCNPGRFLMESGGYFGLRAQVEPSLSTSMDEDSAPLWRDFANRMADERERRLREALCDCRPESTQKRSAA